jgi:hypothetical protein
LSASLLHATATATVVRTATIAEPRRVSIDLEVNAIPSPTALSKFGSAFDRKLFVGIDMDVPGVRHSGGASAYADDRRIGGENRSGTRSTFNRQALPVCGSAMTRFS